MRAGPGNWDSLGQTPTVIWQFERRPDSSDWLVLRDEPMPLQFTSLGHVLSRIYDLDLGAGIYFPTVERYEADTPCIVASDPSNTAAEYASLHQACLDHGFKNWLNVAVVSDTCDAVSEQTEMSLIAAFNADCREGGWLRKMMNYRKSDSSAEATP